MRLLRLDQQNSSPVLPFIKALPPAPASVPPAAPAAPPLPPTAWHAYKRTLKAEDVGNFDPEFQVEQKQGRTTLIPRMIIARNKLVSAFLPCPEYCNSLTFLIVNPVRGIDEAVLDIIHSQIWKRYSTLKEMKYLVKTVFKCPQVRLLYYTSCESLN